MLFTVVSFGIKEHKNTRYILYYNTDVGIVTYATFLLNVSLVLQDQKQVQFDLQFYWIL